MAYIKRTENFLFKFFSIIFELKKFFRIKLNMAGKKRETKKMCLRSRFMKKFFQEGKEKNYENL